MRFLDRSHRNPWRDLNARFGKWSTVYRQFRPWTVVGVWDGICEAFNESDERGDTVQMIDSIIVHAEQHSPAAKKGDSRDVLSATISAVLMVTSRPRSTSGRTALACPSGPS
jgi:transposase